MIFTSYFHILITLPKGIEVPISFCFVMQWKIILTTNLIFKSYICMEGLMNSYNIYRLLNMLGFFQQMNGICCLFWSQMHTDLKQLSEQQHKVLRDIVEDGILHRKSETRVEHRKQNNASSTNQNEIYLHEDGGTKCRRNDLSERREEMWLLSHCISWK